MNTTTMQRVTGGSPVHDIELLPGVTDAARAAGARLLTLFSPHARPRDRAGMLAAIRRNEQVSLIGLREALETLRPGIGWVEEEQETAPLPLGEWWVVDAVEGNVNHVHGLSDWGVSVTLMRDGLPMLAVFHQPIGNFTWTAVRSRGAYLNRRRLKVSDKTLLDAAIVVTGQAEAGQQEANRRIANSVERMLEHALLVRTTVPSTFPMLLVAAGQNDVFWQVETMLSGIAAGILLVEEAGGTVTCIDGSPWHPGSRDVLVAAPGLHSAAVNALQTTH